jgi:large subunit ribosomal protein L29
MPTLKELRALSVEELEAQLEELKRSYFNLRLRHATKELENTSVIRAERRAIAQVSTLIATKRAPAVE